jgi:hypothetical protein
MSSSLFESDTRDDIDKEVEDDDDDDYDDEDDVPKEWDDSTSWVSFLKSVLIYFILTILYGFFASGFIWLTSRGSDIDYILPTNEEFYTAPTYETKIQGPSDEVNCNQTSSGSYAAFVDNFPYNLIITKGSSKEELAGLTFVQRLTNWYGKTVAGCFKTNRAWFKWWLDSFPPDGGLLGNQTFQIYIGFPLTMVLGGFLSLGTGFWAAFGAAVSADMKVTVWGGFLLYAWGLCFALMGLVCARFIATVCFYPMSQAWKDVTNILACNISSLVILFGFFCCGAAYDTLDESIAGIMGIVYLCLIGWTIWKHVSDHFV